MRWRPLIAAMVLVGCQAHVQPTRQPEALPLSELNVDFRKNEEGRLWFTLDLPLVTTRTVHQVRWELWLGSLRFAAGLEGPTATTAAGDGRQRLTVEAPLIYRHLGWVEGAAYLTIRLKAEVELPPPSVMTLRYEGERELVVQGKPVLDVIVD